MPTIQNMKFFVAKTPIRILIKKIFRFSNKNDELNPKIKKELKNIELKSIKKTEYNDRLYLNQFEEFHL